MSKSVSRKRREAILAEFPQHEQGEAQVELWLGNPQKMRALALHKKNVKAANPKPGDTTPDVGSAHRLSVLKVLQNQHGTTYQRAGGKITYEDIETEIAAITNADRRMNAWLDYQEEFWTKDHSLVVLLADEFELDSDDIDAIFDAAVTHRLTQGS
ncbi:hypothetical protein [Thalassospira lohafexi]|uniref:Uncharacterized protein n=1 Tax=Thalassospira lohafexi TaxID=744227 RepID=A0A2N3L0K0_9PROT|nr:hypothetical protein [Thalassospira lohafexi]PKR56334.1 hypothetical protein COO92_21250 [Thalassospira lohafexi]